MVSERTFTDAWRALVFLLLYGTVATAIAPRFSPFVGVAVALVATLALFAAADVLPPLVNGERPLVDQDSRLYSVRGLVVLILVVLVTGVVVTWLRAATALSESVVTVLGITVAVAVVVGPVVAYYRSRSQAEKTVA